VTLYDLAVLADLCDDDAVAAAGPPLPPFQRVPWWRREGSRLVGRIGRDIVEVVHIGARRRRSAVANKNEPTRLPLRSDIKEAAVTALVRMLRAELGVTLGL
jgi:hypothetical protein